MDVSAELRVFRTDRRFICAYLSASVNNSEESSLDQPGEYSGKPIRLQRDSGKHWEQIPRKQRVVVWSWVQPVLCTPSLCCRCVQGSIIVFFSHPRKLRKNVSKTSGVISEREKLYYFVFIIYCLWKTGDPIWRCYHYVKLWVNLPSIRPRSPQFVSI